VSIFTPGLYAAGGQQLANTTICLLTGDADFSEALHRLAGLYTTRLIQLTHDDS
jgi:hypothetical protein